MGKIVLSDRMYVSRDILPAKAVEQRYVVQLFEEKACIKCENLKLQ